MSTQTFEASSVDEALEQAAAALEISAADLQYEVEEKAADFWGMGDTVYVVTVTEPEPEPVAEEPTEEPIEEPVAGEAAAAPAEAVAPEPEAVESAPEVAVEASPAPAAAVPDFFSASAEAHASTEEAPATPEAPAAPSEPTEAPARSAEAAPQAAASGDDLTSEATNILDRIFSAMGFECTAEAKLDGETMHVAITGEDNQYLLEGRGRGLAALELILNHSFRAFPERSHKRVRVDAGDFRSQRDDEIKDIAYQVAHRAKETGSEQQTAEMNPYERRIVHLTLAEDIQVTTRSLGNGFLKAVNVIPTGGRR